MVHWNSKPWAIINSQPMILSEIGNPIKIDWSRIHGELGKKSYDILDELDICLGFNHVLFANGYDEIFEKIVFSSHYIFKKKLEYNLAMVTPRDLGFVKNKDTGEGVPTFKEFILKALVSGYVLCPFHVPILFCLGSNLKNPNSEAFRFATPSFDGVFRFELTIHDDGFILNPIKVDDESLVYLDFPHIFLKADPKHRKRFLKSQYCKEEYSVEKFPDLYEPLRNFDLIFSG